MSFPDLLTKFATAVQDHDGEGLASLFTEDGVYDDIFFGEFRGREQIAHLLNDKFYEGGRDFKWEFRNPVSDGSHGYAAWLFSYTSTTKHAAGTRITFDGVGVYRLRDGLIARYDDVCNGCLPLHQMGTPHDVQDRMLARWHDHLKRRKGYASHQT